MIVYFFIRNEVPLFLQYRAFMGSSGNEVPLFAHFTME